MDTALKATLSKKRIVLATRAKQRREIFEKLEIPFDIVDSGLSTSLTGCRHKRVDYISNYTELESKIRGEAECKARTVYYSIDSDIVIGLDTKVLKPNEIGIDCLTTPTTKGTARKFLKEYSDFIQKYNKPVQVATAVFIYYNIPNSDTPRYTSFIEYTNIYMNNLSDEQIDYYIKTGEPLEKAGGFAIQGGAAAFINKIEGDYYNVMGLPLCRLTAELKKIVENMEWKPVLKPERRSSRIKAQRLRPY